MNIELSLNINEYRIKLFSGSDLDFMSLVFCIFCNLYIYIKYLSLVGGCI